MSRRGEIVASRFSGAVVGIGFHTGAACCRRARLWLAERWSPRHLGENLLSPGTPVSKRARSRNAIH